MKGRYLPPLAHISCCVVCLLVGDSLIGIVPLGVLRLPVPQIAAHRLERLLRLEAQLRLRERRVRGQVGDVSPPIRPRKSAR